jgi:hypothetical protein
MAAKLQNANPLQIRLSHGAKLDPLALLSAIGVRSQKKGTSTMTLQINFSADVNYETHKLWGSALRTVLDYSCYHNHSYAGSDRLLGPVAAGREAQSQT